MSRTIWITAGWTDPQTEEEYRARCRVTIGTRRPSGLHHDSRWVPGDDAAEVEVFAVLSESTGEAREDLVEALQEDREFCELVAAAAEDRYWEERRVMAEDRRMSA